MIGFIFPNEKLEVKDLPKYVVSVQKIEQETQIDFSPMIPGDLKILENTDPDKKQWTNLQ